MNTSKILWNRCFLTCYKFHTRKEEILNVWMFLGPGIQIKVSRDRYEKNNISRILTSILISISESRKVWDVHLHIIRLPVHLQIVFKTWQVIQQKCQKLANVDWREHDHRKWMSYTGSGKQIERTNGLWSGKTNSLIS